MLNYILMPFTEEVSNYINCKKRILYCWNNSNSKISKTSLFIISTPGDVMSGVYQCFSQSRGVVFSEESVQGTPLLVVKAYLPVAESFGFTAHFRSFTSGQVFP